MNSTTAISHRVVCFAFSVIVLAGGGCGLIDSDITRFDLSMPEREFTVHSSSWELSTEAGSNRFPAFPCDPQADLCPELVATVCGNDNCAGICVVEGASGTGTCETTIVVTLSQSVNLRDEKPELSTIDDQPFIDIVIERAEYRIRENSLTIATPEFELFVAPDGVTDPGHPDAQRIGTIPIIEAGGERPWTEILLGADENASLRQFMGDFQTTFQVLITTTIAVPPGQPIPEGSIVAGFRVDAYAGL